MTVNRMAAIMINTRGKAASYSSRTVPTRNKCYIYQVIKCSDRPIRRPEFNTTFPPKHAPFRGFGGPAHQIIYIMIPRQPRKLVLMNIHVCPRGTVRAVWNNVICHVFVEHRLVVCYG